MDAYSHNHKSLHGYNYCDLVTDLASRQVYPVFTKDRSAEELCERISVLFYAHPEWKDTGSSSWPRFIRVDPERNYISETFRRHMFTFGYRIEKTAPRDKHANGIAERQVGTITAKANIAMLAPSPRVPPGTGTLHSPMLVLLSPSITTRLSRRLHTLTSLANPLI
jgi:hypothetical protein